MAPLLPAALLLLAVLAAAGGLVAIRRSGAEQGIARRLAGARQVRLSELFAMRDLPARPVRIAGRIRCPDPIVTERGDRLVARHRDVQVQPRGGGWRSIERIRESRGFELWDHGGSLPVDAAQAAEPLVAIPHVWRGTSAELQDRAHLSAVDRLGGGPMPARSITRAVSVVERLLVLASVVRDEAGTIWLRPPPGGYVISTLELDDAMRLLGGPHRRLLLAGYALLALGLLTAAASAILYAGSIVG
jgi:hypothetical protein